MATPINMHAADLVNFRDMEPGAPVTPLDTCIETIRQTGNAVCRAAQRAKWTKADLMIARHRIARGTVADIPAAESRVRFALVNVRLALKLHRLAWQGRRNVEDLMAIARTARLPN